MPATNPDATYWVVICLGTATDHVEFTVSSADVVDPDAPLQVLDRLRFGWAWPTTEPFPAHPDPVTCTLGLLALDVADLAPYTIEGTPVEVSVWANGAPDSGGDRWLTFAGRINSGSAVPVRRNDTDVTLFTVSCSDYLVDLAELVVDFGDFPQESTDDRLTRIDTLIRAAGNVGLSLSVTTGPTLAASSPGSAAALDVLKDTLRQLAQGGGGQWTRWYLKPRTVLDSQAPAEYELATYAATLNPTELPAVFVTTGGVLELDFPGTIAGDTTKGLVSASVVELETAAWVTRKRDAATVVTVAGPFPAGVVQAAHVGVHPVKLELSSTHVDDDSAELMASMYLPPLESSRSWEVGKLVIHAGELIDFTQAGGRIREWFPDPTADAVFSTWPIGPVVVTEVPDSLNLTGPTGIYAGQIAAVDLVIQNRKIDLEVSLRRTLPLADASVGDRASYDHVEADFPTIDYDHVDPDLTYYDTRLVRKP